MALASGASQRGERRRVAIQGHHPGPELGGGQGVATATAGQVEDGASRRRVGQTR